MTRLQVRFDGKVLVPLEPVDLPQGQVFEVDVHEETGLPVGSPELLLRIMDAPPHVSQEDVDAMNRAIEEGKMPVRYEGIFDGDDK